MESLYHKKEAEASIARYPTSPKELALRVYTSRLIGQNPDLVLHGGGNTSVKVKITNILGEEMDVFFVKGSGWDLATIEPQGFPGLDLAYLRKLRRLETLSDEEMVNQLRTHLLDASSPDPSVEALLHAFLPHRFVDHTHADSILILTNQKEGEVLVREALGPKAAFVPFIMPGFPLAKAVADLYERSPDIEAIVLSHHGLFTFGEDARTAYERMITYVDRAERFIAERIRGKTLTRRCPDSKAPTDRASGAARVAQAIRGTLAYQDEQRRLRRFILELRDAPDLVEVSLSEEAKRICTTGVLTPDHIIRTKNSPVFLNVVPDEDEELKRIVRQAVETYKQQYDAYFEANVQVKSVQRKQLDPYPRIFLVAGIGLFAAGFTRKDALIAADIAEHTVRAKRKAEALGGYHPLPESDLFDMEYWSLEQKKLGKAEPLPLQGQIAVVTGGGGAMALGIGDRLLAAGAVVILTDVNQERLEKVRARLAARYGSRQVEALVIDVTDLKSVEEGFDEISRKVGGVDIVVPNAGIAHVAEIERMELDDLKRVLDVNLLGTFTVIKAAAQVFRRQGTGGNIIVNSTKNVFDPGAAFGAYSASKAGAHQLAKVAALELAPLNVRVNLINADAVFGDDELPSGLWEVVGPERMRARGLQPEELKAYYRNRSLLKAEVRAEHVGNAVVFFATEQTPTTGATLPVDGGLPGAFPR
ncbi:MAG: bifunctional aldolase/short-chain dehydrogenase [candidate division NC10 bacterium]|nr:bifunctional aldolase/short-chain dehydrogenase [candidate division NC10 bacterium]